MTDYIFPTLCHDLLDRDTELDLLIRSKNGDEEAVNLLVIHNQRLVYHLARRFYAAGRAGDQQLDDLMQWGNIGLLIAIRRFDPARNVRFSTYATYWISMYIHRYGSKFGIPFGIPYSFLRDNSNVRYTCARLQQENQHEPNPGEIADATGLSEQSVTNALAISVPMVSLDSRLEEDEKSADNLYDAIPDHEFDLEAEIDGRLTKQAIRNALNQLPPVWKHVLQTKYGIDCTPKLAAEIARELNVSHTRIQQIEAEALLRLRFILQKSSKN